MRARWQIARNTFWRGKLIRKLLTVLVLMILLAISYGLYRVSGFVVGGLQALAREPETRELIAQLGSLDRIFAAVPSLALGTFALPMLLSSVSFALSTLYFARDLDTLLVTPVPVRSVFLARFLEGLGATYLMLFVLLLPALAGYGQALGYGIGFYVVLLLVLLLLPLLPVSIGTLLTMLLVRFIPAKRLRDVLTIVGGLFGLLIYFGSQLLNRVATDIATPQTAEQLLRFDVPALPTSWGARALIAAGTGDLPTLLLFGGLYGLATAGLFAICMTLAGRLYLGGLVGMAGTEGGRVKRRTRTIDVPGGSLWRGPVAAIVRKELRVLPRDLQQLSQLLFPLAIAIFWVWQVFTDNDLQRSPLTRGPDLTHLTLVSIGLFVCLLIASHLGLTGLSREGRSFWLLQLAPISPWTVLWAKWILAFSPFAIVGTLFVAVIALLQPLTPGVIVSDWLLVLLTGGGVAGITVGLGAAFPRFDWQQPRRMASARAGCLGPILYFAYTALMLGLTAGAQFFAADWGGWVIAAGWALALLLTAAALLLPMQLGASRLRRIEL
jgi:ABC-2 type transport system permease protein